MNSDVSLGMRQPDQFALIGTAPLTDDQASERDALLLENAAHSVLSNAWAEPGDRDGSQKRAVRKHRPS